MSKRSILAAAVIGLLIGLPALADAYSYDSIQANLLDGSPDTSFVDGTLTIASGIGGGQLTLNDPTPLPGTVTDLDLNLTTNFIAPIQGTMPLQALFGGGSFSLTFKYDGVDHFIEGPIGGMVFYVSAPQFISGEGLFAALFDLPGSNDWAPAPLESSIKSLTLSFDQDLSDYQWDEPLDNHLETSLTLYPDDTAVPGPAALLLLLPGMALLRRK